MVREVILIKNEEKRKWEESAKHLRIKRHLSRL